MDAIEPKYFEILKDYDTPTVCNVIELFDEGPRDRIFLGGKIEALFPELPPIVGYATTATFRSAVPKKEGDRSCSLPDQVEQFEREIPRPRVVVFQDLDEEPCGATFGEVMCTMYQSFGCVGLVTSGGARDLDQVREKKFACFASSVIPAHAYCRIVEVNIPVTVGGTLIRPGDVIHADRNGVTTVPSEIVPEVALGCAKLTAAEGHVFEYLKGQKNPTLEGLREAFKKLLSHRDRIVREIREELGR